MTLFAQQGPSDTQVITIIVLFVLFFFAVIAMAVFARYFRLWIQSKTTGAGISIFDLLGMTFRKVNPAVIVRSKIMAVQAGIGDEHGVTSKALEAPLSGRRQRAPGHPLAGGREQGQVGRSELQAGNGHRPGRAQRARSGADQRLSQGDRLPGPQHRQGIARRRGPEWHPIEGPRPGDGPRKPEAVDRRGHGRDDHRPRRRGHRQRHRHGQAAHRSVGSARPHLEDGARAPARCADGPSRLCPIDIAGVDVGDNIGARLQADQAEADMRVARANAEGRRAMAVAEEQEMIALIEENRAKVVEAEAQVPKAIAQAFQEATLGIVDYYKLRNVQADTDMRTAIARVGSTTAGRKAGTTA